MQLQAQIEEVDAKLTAYHRADECSRRLVKIPSVGPIGAMLLRMKTPAPTQFKSGRQFAAWIGLTPKDHSTAGKLRLGVITRAGDETLRSVLVVGATAAIQQAQRSGKASPWLAALLKRKSPKLAAVALANKTARVAWKMMPTGEEYSLKSAATVPAAAAEDQPDTGSNRTATVLSRCQSLQDNEQRCDRSIHDTEYSDRANGLVLVARVFGTRAAETILASVHVRAHQQAGHMDASDLIKTLRQPLLRTWSGRESDQAAQKSACL